MAGLSAGRPILESIASAKLRDQLTAELQVLSSADEATAWARRSLPSKNTLTAADARMVEAAFQLKISALTDEQSEPPEAGHNQAVSAPTLAIGIPAEEMHEPVPSAPSDGAHAIPLVCCPVVKPRRIRDKLHRQYVAAQACLICGRQPADAHHLRFAQPRAMGRKSSDEFTVPLCRIHHRELHQAGKEMAWWEGFRINPVEVAARLWARTVAARQA